MRTLTIRAAMLCVVPLALVSQAYCAGLELPQDGWASWQVAAVEDAPDQCCWSSWDDRDPARKSCRLDDDRNNFGSRDDANTDAVRVYARTAGGQVERLRAYSATCAVESATPIRQLGIVTADDSARWLIAQFKGGAAKNDDLRENVLAALAMHRGDVALDALAAIARGDASIGHRKPALFWLAVLRGAAGADITSAVMFGSTDVEVRKHAIFALTRSKAPRVVPDVIRLGNTDKSGDVRGQAWFWLAQTGAANADGAILAAIRNEDDEDVRDQATFALSQLPAERATRALVTVAEDRSMGREQRKRALFWLAQSEASGAQTYLEKVLTGNGAD